MKHMTTQEFNTKVEAYIEENKLDAPYYYKWLQAAVAVAKPKNVVELGTWYGGSIQHIYYGLGDRQDVSCITIDKVRHEPGVPLDIDERVKQIIGFSQAPETVAQIPDGIDFLFIDTDHSYDQVAAEWKAYEPKLADGCIVALDDIHAIGGWFDGVTHDKLDISKYHTESGFGFFIYKKHD